MSKNKNIPKIKRERVGKGRKFKEKVVDSSGKERTLKGEQFAEKEIEDRRLIKIAPFYWFSLDSHKVLMIPFSMQFSPEMFIEQTGKQAVNFQKIIENAKKQEAEFDKIDNGESK